jgi:hypothetical protein
MHFDPSFGSRQLNKALKRVLALLDASRAGNVAGQFVRTGWGESAPGASKLEPGRPSHRRTAAQHAAEGRMKHSRDIFLHMRLYFSQGPREIMFFKTRYCDTFTVGRLCFSQGSFCASPAAPFRLYGAVAHLQVHAKSSRHFKGVARRIAVSPCAIPRLR